MLRYDPLAIEAKWQEKWERDGTYTVDFADHSKPKYYGLSMLPGITGAGIHIGHGRTFQFSDIKVRAKRQQGFNAYNPIGWDSFGLPVENYAIKVGKNPREAHDEALKHFKTQLKRLGYSYDWSCEISTADPRYYKWTQWIFNQLYEHKLAYQKESPQWWCETDKTVLANEQVEAGKCVRCGHPVIKKNLKQWFFKITEYADEMLEATDDLNWTEMVKTMQKNWIGKSQGAEVDFSVDQSNQKITVFTTRVDTLFSGAFIVLAPEHELVSKVTTSEQRKDVEDYQTKTAQKSDIERQSLAEKEKTGVFTGAYAVNPVNGEKLPIWIGDFVFSGYGTGAVFGDIHDERDFEFLNKYKIPARVTVVPDDKSEADRVLAKEYAYTGEGILVDSGAFTGMRTEQAREEITAWLEQQGFGRSKTQYKMRDWLISRQRYWGAPIPIIHCPEHGAVPVPDKDLPVVLPEVVDYKPTGGDTSVLASASDWVNTICPTCNKPAKRETDTMDGYACSSWYFLRYLDPFNDKQAWDPDVIEHWSPVDFYNGADHAVAHLLYARFWMRFFYKLDLVNTPEPFKRMMYNAYVMASDGRKMSKSLGNVIDPLEIIDSGYGADSLRVYEMFIAPYDMEAPWDDRGVPGTYRFLNRVWNLTQQYIQAKKMNLDKEDEVDLLRVAHRTVKKVTEDIENDKFNTAVSSMMKAVNSYFKYKDSFGIGKNPAWTFAIESLLQVLAPFAPHITEELWAQLGHKDTIHIDHWPQWQDKYLVSEYVTIPVQVNGKVRITLEVAADISEKDIIDMAKAHEKVTPYLEGKELIKAIYVPKRIVNLVI